MPVKDFTGLLHIMDTLVFMKNLVNWDLVDNVVMGFTAHMGCP